MADVGYRDFPKFMGFLEFMNDSTAVKKNVALMVKETRTWNTASKALEVAKGKSHGIETYEQALEKSNKLIEEAHTFDKETREAASRFKSDSEDTIKTATRQLAKDQAQFQRYKIEEEDVLTELRRGIETDRDILVQAKEELEGLQNAFNKERDEYKRKKELIDAVDI